MGLLMPPHTLEAEGGPVSPLGPGVGVGFRPRHPTYPLLPPNVQLGQLSILKGSI